MQLIFDKYNINPKKSLGQNFLINDSILDKIASTIDIIGKNIIEVGPWYWALTDKLLQKKPGNLTLVEFDKKMVEILEDRIVTNDLKSWNTQIIIDNVDILKFTPNFSSYSVIANIPYYITSPILTHFFYDIDNHPDEMVILMQKDVWDKIRKVNWNKTSVLSLMCEIACEEIKEITKVGANNFVPPPKIESAVLYFKLRKTINSLESKKLIKIIKIWFSERRKKLFSNLVKNNIFTPEKLAEIFEKNWFNQNIRAEELNLENWKKLLIELQN